LDDVRELVVTLSVAQKKIVKVEAVEPSGARHALADQDFAELVGEDEEETLVAALEEAYAAGAEDALEDDDEPAAEGDGVEHHRTIMWEAAARQDLRRSVRRLILSRALRRISAPPSESPAQNARKGASNAKRSSNRQQRA
jgi:hypothetical protein